MLPLVSLVSTACVLLAQDAPVPAGPDPTGGAPDPTKTAPGAGGPSGMCSMSQLILMAVMFGVFWFVVIRPQRKQEQARKALLEALKAGDKVRTRGGIVGKVARVKDNLVYVRVGDEKQVEIPVERSYIDDVVGDAPPKDKA
ncbi:MAG: hypothetical protein HMLKMBBP_00442 [Planctomycetes bacterium]|nr:hypothetical protein [Planctomycetota bacterium]